MEVPWLVSCYFSQPVLVTTKVAILLVSPDFLNSDFIYDNELLPLLDAAEKEGLKIFWIPIRASGYKKTAIEKYQAAHPPDKPLKMLTDGEKDLAWVNICEKLEEAMEAGNPLN